jgi:hypothetical protein
VAYSDNATPSGGNATVMKFSGAWGIVGRVGFTADAADSPSLAFAPDGTPYVAYSDFGTNGNASVMKLFSSPVITSISPSNGSPLGGAAVTITGTGFTGATAVAFGGNSAASFTVDSDTQISVTSPAGSAVTVDITVTTPIGTSATSTADQFSYNMNAPGAPTKVKAIAGNGQVTVIFTPPAIDGGSQLNYTVTATPGNITAGGQSSPITVTGLNNSTDYTFTVTATNAAGLTGPAAPASDKLYGVNVTVNGTGGGMVYSIPSGIDSSIGPFSNVFNSGLTVNLMQAASPGSYISGWGGPCTINGQSCDVTMNALYQSVTATFDSYPYVQLVGDPQKYGLIKRAYDAAVAAAATDAVIKARGLTFAEDLAMTAHMNLTIKGAWDPTFSTQNGYTILQGSLTIKQGKLVVDHLVIR